MRDRSEILSADSLPEPRARTLPPRQSTGFHPGLAVLGCGLAFLALAATWVACGSPGKASLEGFFGSWGFLAAKGSSGAVPEAAGGRLTGAEIAAMAVIGGMQAPERAKLPKGLRDLPDGAADATGEQALINALEKGSDAEALEAIRALTALGGDLNRRRLAAIMKDNRWPDALRTAAAQGLITTGTPVEAELGVRALAVIGGEANTESLKAMIDNAKLPTPLRLEAALGMGTIGTPTARDALIKSFKEFSEPEIHEQLIGALGHFPFPQIEATWKQFLGDANTPSALRVAAVDALANSTPEALPFLKTMAGTDRDPEVREMSAWAISALGAEDETMGPELARMATVEPEVDVRRRLYEALPTQATNPAEGLLAMIQGETDLAARVAGFNALGDAVKRGVSLASRTEFDTKIIPELTAIAVSDETMNLRMRAVFALRRAETFAAREALKVISQTENPQIAQAARHGLPATK